jgi:intein/homing endonuclease
MSLSYGTIKTVNNILKTKFEGKKNLDYHDIFTLFDEYFNNFGNYAAGGEKVKEKSEHRKIFEGFVEYLLYRNLANYDAMVLISAIKGCLTDDTLIEMPRDMIKYPKGVPIKDLIGKENFYVYSYNIKNNRIEVKKAKSCEYAKTADVYELELVNGYKIKATEDHPFLMMDGTYKQLKDIFWAKGKCKSFVNRKNKRINTDRLKIFLRSDILDQKQLFKVDYSKFGTKEFSEKCRNDRKLYWERIKKEDPEYYEEYVNKIKKHALSKSNYTLYGGTVKNIKYIGKEKTYDIVGVEDNRNFIANGFMVSNTGKSSFALMLAYFWCKLLGIRFDPDRHIAYTNAQVMDRIEKLNPFEPLICLTGDTKITIRDKEGERLVEIKNLINKNDYEVKSYNIKKDIFEWIKPEKCIENGIRKDIYELELENGNKIQATSDHKIFTKNGYKKISELNRNDNVFINNIKNNKTSRVKNITKIKTIGKKVYDIINVGNNHNFIANNILVSNCDESASFASSEDWNKRENKDLKQKLAKIRTKHLLFIMCFPLKINKLDKVYLESYVNYWVDLFARGIGALYVKDNNPYMDTWRLKEFEKLGSYTEFTQVNKIKQILAKHPNFWYIVKAPKPPETLYNKYLKVREYNVYDDANALASVNKYDIVRSMLLCTLKEILTRDSTLSVKRLLLHLENEYKVSIDKSLYESIMEDSRMLVQKVKENNLGVALK